MDLISLYLQYVAPLKGSPNYHRWAIFSVISALLERRVWIDRGRHGILFPNTYTILVGIPATGKSKTAGIAFEMLKKVKAPGRLLPHIGPTKITQAALYKELHDSERVYRLPGIGESKSTPIFILASELSMNMNDFGGGTLTDELLEFYDSGFHDKVIQKRTAKDGIVTLPNPSITFLGCTTAEFLQKAAKMQLITSGLSSRILFVVETQPVEKEFNKVATDETLYNAILTKLSQIYDMKGQMILEPDANVRYIELANLAHANGSRLDVGAFYQNYYGRKPDHLLKCAMVFAAIRNKYTISINDIESARAWIEALEPTMISAFGLHSIERDPDLAAQILTAIADAPNWTTQGDMLKKLREAGKFVPDSPIFRATMESLIKSRKLLIKGSGNGQAEHTLYSKIV